MIRTKLKHKIKSIIKKSIDLSEINQKIFPQQKTKNLLQLIEKLKNFFENQS